MNALLMGLEYYVNNSLFIPMCILREIPQAKNPRALCQGSFLQFYMFP
jgi:hypothetical protein